ncbi:MAG TPA: enoyl-CoA hydratase-related protein [bacterium]|nr:enoyl-CoA hydratase-related protein [bacterium]
MISLERAGAVGQISLHRPPANAYNRQFAQELDEAVEAVRAEDGIQAVVLTSTVPRFFSAGADVKFFQAATLPEKEKFILRMHEVLRKIELTPKVFIAAITGHCLGGGMEIALSCDLRFAAAGKYGLGQPEIALGILPGNGGTQRLPRLIGKSRALDLMLTGRMVSPEEALSIGLVDRVFPAEELSAKTREYAEALTKSATMAVGLIKLTVTRGMELPLEGGLAYEREALFRTFASEDAAEGVNAFLEKRPPAFKGR